MSKMFRLEEFPGILKEITIKDDGNEKKGKVVFEFEDAEWEVKVTVKPKFEDLLEQFFVGVPYKITLTPMVKQLNDFGDSGSDENAEW